LYHVKQVPDGVCLETAYFVPPGYSSVLWPLGRIFDAHRCPSMANAFVDYVMEKFDVQRIKKQEFNIIILDQPPHIIHPRSSVSSDNNGQQRTKFLNDLETKILSETDATNVQVKDLHSLPFKAQLKVIRSAHILIGYSSAGDKLIHAMFLHDNTKVIDISDILDGGDGNFGTGSDLENMLAWRPSVQYKYNIPANFDHVIAEVKDVLTPGWDADVDRYPNDMEEEEFSFQEGLYDDEFANYTDTFNRTDDYFADEIMDNNNNNKEWNITSDDKLKGDGMGFDMSSENENSNPNYYDRSTDYTRCGLYSGVFADDVSSENGCVVDGTEGSNIPICRAKQLQLDLAKIDFHGVLGGEYLDTVMGQEEDVEFPTYTHGAFVTSMDNLPNAKTMKDEEWKQLHHLQDIFRATKTEPYSNYNQQKCALIIKEPTYFITRYEYVDPMRTLSDWWNTYWSSSFPTTTTTTSDNSNEQPRIIFLDSHAAGNLDPVWNHVFGPVTHIAQLLSPEDNNKLVCIEDARFIPSGYSSYLTSDEKTLRPCPAMTEKFVQHFLKSYGLENVSMERGRITIVQPPNVITHPRMKATTPGENAQTTLLLQTVKEQLQQQLTTTTTTTTIKIVQMERMSFMEQLRTLRQTHILIGIGQQWLEPHLLFLSDNGARVFDIGTEHARTSVLNWKRNITYRYNILTQESNDNSNTTATQIQNRLLPLVQYALNKELR